MADHAVTADGRYAERVRRAAEMQAAWAAEDAANVIDLRDGASVAPAEPRCVADA